MLLAIYLNDHLAGATAGTALARRSAGGTQDARRRALLAELTKEIAQDRQMLLSIMNALEISVDPIKIRAASLGEKLARLKPNGRLWSRSPMTDVVELEALTLGVTGKHALWCALELLQPQHPSLEQFDLAQLRQRAESQLERLEAHRRDAIADAFSTESTRHVQDKRTS